MATDEGVISSKFISKMILNESCKTTAAHTGCGLSKSLRNIFPAACSGGDY